MFGDFAGFIQIQKKAIHTWYMIPEFGQFLTDFEVKPMPAQD